MTAGFFLGFDVVENGTRFEVGNNVNYLRWNGTTIELKTKKALELIAENVGGAVLTFTSYAEGNTQTLYFDYVNGFNQLKWPGVFDANYVNITYGSFAFIDAASATTTAKNVIHFRMGPSNPNWTAFHFNGSNGLLSYSHNLGAPSFQFTAWQGPASNAAGVPGQMVSNGAFIYVCVSSGDWRRVALIDNY